MLKRRRALLAAGPALAVALALTAAPAVADPSANSDPRAKSHPPANSLDRFYQQRIDWKKCQLNPSDETGAELDRAGAQCADLTVPLDYSAPTGRTIKVAISRLKATDTARRVGVLLVNGGGPGGPGIDMAPGIRQHLKAVGPRYDVVGMDPRFIGRSTPLDCGWPTSTFLHSPGGDRADFDRSVAFQRDLAARCRQRHAAVLPHVTTRNTARDMDVIRAALGERKLSYLGYSYGTYLGAVYTQMFGHRADRVVLDGALDPRRYGARMLVASGPVAERVLGDWAGWAAERHASYGLGRTKGEVLATVHRVLRTSAQRPLRVGEWLVDDRLVPVLLYIGVVDDRDGPRAALAEAVRVLDQAATTGSASPTEWLAENLRFMETGVESHYASAQVAILCGDVAVPTDPRVYWRDIERSRASQPVFGPLANGISPCAFLPPPREPKTVVRNGVPALIVAATGDSRTVYAQGQALHGLLRNSRLVTLDGANTHGVYGEYGNACVDGIVNAYFDTGRLPAKNPTCTKS